MAVAKSTINILVNTTAGKLILWSSLDSDANNTYFDVNNKDVGKMVFLIAHNCSTDVGTTCGWFYLGCSGASVCSGTSYAQDEFSARRLGRMVLKCAPPTTDLTEALGCTQLAHVAITAFGPFESARFKDSKGYIKISKREGTSDTGRVKIAAILLP